MAAGAESGARSGALGETGEVFVPKVEDLPERARSLSLKETCRPVYWHEDKVWLVDQRKLPGTLTVSSFETLEAVSEAIRAMVVRGAPALSIAGAYGVVLAVRAHVATSEAPTAASVAACTEESKRKMDASRPTAVNLMWATARLVDAARALAEKDVPAAAAAEALLSEAHDITDEDVRVNKAMAEAGAALIPDKANLLHHCNTGALATIDYGTALGVIYECHQQGKGIHVWVDETRPRLQGSRLTAWELMRGGVPMHLIADSAAGILMLRKRVDAVLFGADRVAANGDVANKVGTYKVCVVARENDVPTYAVVPTSTIDLDTLSGDDIPIEERGADEVTHLAGAPTAPDGCPVYNPAFDVTPAKYLTAIITEVGVCYPPFEESLRRAVLTAREQRAAHLSDRIAHLLATLAPKT